MRNIFKQARRTTPLSELSPAAKKFELMRRSLDAAYAAHVALTDIRTGGIKSEQDKILSSNPDIVDLRHRHPDHQTNRALTSADIDPQRYLNGFVVRSHVTLIPAETEPAQVVQDVV